MLFQDAEIIKLESTESTNLYTSELLKSNVLSEGSVVTAISQTQGKGQENNRWESEPGKNLTATIVLYPTFLKPELQFMLTKVVSLSVCSVLDKFALPSAAMIKWPNDILINNRKIAGILINNEINGNTISCTIAGLGLNVNQKIFSTYLPEAISLRLITGTEHNLDNILSDWHKSMAFWYEKLMKSDFSTLDNAYLERLYRLNQPANYIIRDKRMKATIMGLAEYGMLLLKNENGQLYKCPLKEVVFL